MIIVRQSTARTVMVGPILDADGVAVTDVAVGDLKISKNGGAPAGLNGSATLTHRHTGHYSLALTTSDTDTVGQAEVVIDDSTNAMPVKELQVIEEAIYDALFAASATGALPVSSGGIASTAFAAGAIDAAAIANGAIDAATFAADVDAEILSYLVDDATRIDASALNTASGTTIPAIDAKTTNLPSDPADASVIAGRFDTLDTSIGDLPTNSELATALGAADDAILAVLGTPADTDLATDIANMQGDVTDILADTNELQTDDTPGALAAIDAKIDTIDGNVDDILTDTGTTLQDELDGIQADTEDIQSRLPAALTGGGNIKADVLAISGDTTAADYLEALADGGIIGQINDASATTTGFIADGFTEATNDHFNGRLITFISGALKGQQTAIEDYVGATQTFTVTALTEAPADEDFFVIH